ncbi:MAG: hypothetical protein HY221_01625 [Candidatus Sungbacteria bacterium]|uniref:Uncharacterized protein n=1 Tax=Candidatus Sungiibacteriota bacterium TaxID=2750080 RepID=A0A932R1K1_9BACT|nr:hypothetical protein [Candidatus Sungbacteria bacterium]
MLEKVFRLTLIGAIVLLSLIAGRHTYEFWRQGWQGFVPYMQLKMLKPADMPRGDVP